MLYYTTNSEDKVYNGQQNSLGGYATNEMLPKTKQNGLFSDIVFNCAEVDSCFYRCLFYSGGTGATITGFSDNPKVEIALINSKNVNEGKRNTTPKTVIVQAENEEPWIADDFFPSIVVNDNSFFWVKMEVKGAIEEGELINIDLKILT